VKGRDILFEDGGYGVFVFIFSEGSDLFCVYLLFMHINIKLSFNE
jgi:hypothetical protein